MHRFPLTGEFIHLDAPLDVYRVDTVIHVLGENKPVAADVYATKVYITGAGYVFDAKGHRAPFKRSDLTTANEG